MPQIFIARSVDNDDNDDGNDDDDDDDNDDDDDDNDDDDDDGDDNNDGDDQSKAAKNVFFAETPTNGGRLAFKRSRQHQHSSVESFLSSNPWTSASNGLLYIRMLLRFSRRNRKTSCYPVGPMYSR